MGEETKFETGWLIERQDRGSPEWLQIDVLENRWIKDASEALRFARRVDAESYSDATGLDDPGFTVYITEHRWG